MDRSRACNDFSRAVRWRCLVREGVSCFPILIGSELSIDGAGRQSHLFLLICSIVPRFYFALKYRLLRTRIDESSIKLRVCASGLCSVE